jgi:hypothetical protein
MGGYCGGYPLVNIQKTDGKITMLSMGKLTISMAIFNCYVKLPEGNDDYHPLSCDGISRRRTSEKKTENMANHPNKTSHSGTTWK